MKILFQTNGKRVQLIDSEDLIFNVDGKLINASGAEISKDEYEQKHKKNDIHEEDEWYEEWMEYEGVEELLKAESIVEPEWEIDDVFGKYGFKNKEGEFVIEPQYAFAHEFTNGLAAVNLIRTWYRTEEGKRFYENHYGYIDSNGKTVIGFQYDEASPFNKYGVAVVYDTVKGYMLIDQTGAEIPGTRFGYMIPYLRYGERFLEFSYEDDREDEPVGIYDTKERKVLLEPSVDSITEWEEDCILVDVRGGKYGINEMHPYYINSKGEIIYQWLYEKGFAKIERPDMNDVTAVAIAEYTELTSKSKGYFLCNGKMYERTFLYGLYSSKGVFLLPLEYDKIEKVIDNIWICNKGEEWFLVETEEGD